jgi:hypothetical protein
MKPEFEREFARKVVGQLEDGLDQLGPDVEARLQAARRLALDHYRESPRPVLGLAWAGGWGMLGQERFAGVRNMTIGMLLLLSALGIVYHQQVVQPENELVDTEISLLTGELPINAYFDKEFDTWLKQSQQ